MTLSVSTGVSVSPSPISRPHTVVLEERSCSCTSTLRPMPGASVQWRWNRERTRASALKKQHKTVSTLVSTLQFQRCLRFHTGSHSHTYKAIKWNYFIIIIMSWSVLHKCVFQSRIETGFALAALMHSMCTSCVCMYYAICLAALVMTWLCWGVWNRGYRQVQSRRGKTIKRNRGRDQRDCVIE